MKLKIGKVDFFIYSFWIIFFSIVLSGYQYTDVDPLVIVTFFIIGIIAFCKAVSGKRNVTIKRNYYIFYLIFFFFAPLQQYLSRTRLWSGNGMSIIYTDNDYLIVNFLLLASMLIVTFFIIGIIAFCKAVSGKRNVTIKRNYYIFYLIFFFFAPLQQYLSRTRLWSGNGMSIIYTDNDYLIVNFLLLASMFFFEIGYYFCERKVKKSKRRNAAHEYMMRGDKASMFLLLGITILSAGLIIATKGMTNIILESAMISQIKHMVLFAPVICIIICLINIKDRKIKAKKLLVCISLITVAVYLFYSGTMARFILLGAVMAVVSYALFDNKNKSIYFSVYIAGFFFAFSTLRNKNIFEGNLLNFVDFRQVDYDAYQIFILVVRYVKEHGISWGMNIVSAIFCFIPRSIANWRMEATGGIVISAAGSWFKNVSCPIPAEMYFAFGIAGIIILDVLFGVLVCWLDNKCVERSHFYKGLFSILSGVTLYVMRGSLLSSFSYTVGIMLAYWGVYNCVYMKVKIHTK